MTAPGRHRRRISALVALSFAALAIVGCSPVVDGDGADASSNASAAPHATRPNAAAARATATSTPVANPPPIRLGPGALVALPDAASQWVAAHPSDPRAALITKYIAGKPTALWLTGNSSFGNLNSAIHVANAKNGTLTLTLWNIPLRWDGISAPSTTTLSQYKQWVSTIATRLHATRAIVILEPDALWFYDRMPTVASQKVRRQALQYALSQLATKAPGTRVYIDAGTSSGSVTPARMATLLAGVGLSQAAGFAVNVSSYSPTAQVQDYAQQIRAALQQQGYPDPRYVIDTGRNGATTWNYTWCNPTSQRLGRAPRVVSNTTGLDLDLWVKAPGTSDGNCGPVGAGAGSYGGQFLPAVAYKMITG